jgi:hypothetical protein
MGGWFGPVVLVVVLTLVDVVLGLLVDVDDEVLDEVEVEVEVLLVVVVFFGPPLGAAITGSAMMSASTVLATSLSPG